MSWIRWQGRILDRDGVPKHIMRFHWECLREIPVHKIFNSQLQQNFNGISREAGVDWIWILHHTFIVVAGAQSCSCKVVGACSGSKSWTRWWAPELKGATKPKTSYWAWLACVEQKLRQVFCEVRPPHSLRDSGKPSGNLKGESGTLLTWCIVLVWCWWHQWRILSGCGRTTLRIWLIRVQPKGHTFETFFKKSLQMVVFDVGLWLDCKMTQTFSIEYKSWQPIESSLLLQKDA